MSLCTSSTSTNATASNGYNKVRKRLDQLGYREPLGFESLPLAERLFADLVHTTESLKDSRDDIDKLRSDLNVWKSHVEPLKKENRRLIVENNDLHRQLVLGKETNDNSEMNTTRQVKTLEGQVDDLKFLLNQYAAKLHAQEQHMYLQKEKMTSLLDRNVSAVIRLPDGGTERLQLRPQTLDVSFHLDSNTADNYDNIRTDIETSKHPYEEDLKVAGAQIHSLREQVNEMIQSRSSADRKRLVLTEQLSARDAEIARLAAELEKGRAAESLSAENLVDVNAKLIAQRSVQLEYLQETNATLESELAKTRAKAGAAAVLIKEKEELTNALDEVKRKNISLRDDMRKLENRCRTLKTKKETNNNVSASSTPVRRTVNKELGEDNPLNSPRKRTPVASSEKAFGNPRVVRETPISDETKTTQDLNSEISCLRKELHSMEGSHREVEELRRELAAVIEELETTTERLVFAENDRDKALEDGGENAEELRENRRALDQMNSLQNQVAALKAELASSHAARATSDKIASQASRDADIATKRLSYIKLEKANIVKELEIVTKEREDLSHALASFEAQMAGIQTSASSLRADRDDADSRLKLRQQELDKLTDSYDMIAKEETNLKRRLEQANIERDEAISHKSAAEGESKRLQALLHTTNEAKDSAQKEIDKHCKKILELEEQCREAGRLHDEHQSRVHANIISSAEQQRVVTELTADVDRLKLSLSEREAEVRQLSSLVTRLDTVRDGQITQNQQILADIRSHETKTAEAQHEAELLARKLNTSEKEVADLRLMLSTLDHDKNILQDDMDHKAELIAEFDVLREQQESEILNLRKELNLLRVQLRDLQRTVTERDSDVHSLQTQVARTKRDFNDQATAVQHRTFEIQSLSNDLQTMVVEAQATNADLAVTLNERDELRTLVDKQREHIHQLEEQINRSERECHAFSEDLRRSTADRQRDSDEIEVMASNCRTHIATIETLQSQLNSANVENETIRREIRVIDGQVGDLLNNMAAKESRCEELEADKEMVERELRASKDLVNGLELVREDMSRKLAESSIEHQVLKARVTSSDAEAGMGMNQAAQLRTRVAELEELLGKERDKEFQAQMSVQDNNAKSAVWRDRCDKIELKLSVLAAENGQIKAARAAAESTLETTQSRLTSVEYDLAHTQAELRNWQIGNTALNHTLEQNYDTVTELESERERLRSHAATLEVTVAHLEKQIEEMNDGKNESAGRNSSTSSEMLNMQNIEKELLETRRQLRATEQQLTNEGALVVQLQAELDRERKIMRDAQQNYMKDAERPISSRTSGGDANLHLEDSGSSNNSDTGELSII